MGADSLGWPQNFQSRTKHANIWQNKCEGGWFCLHTRQSCLASRDGIQVFFQWLSDVSIITFALPMCLYSQLAMPTYGLFPCPGHSVDGCTAQSASRNATQCNLHFSVASISLFAKELQSTSAGYFKWSSKKDWNKPETKEITSKNLNKQHPYHSAPCLSMF